MLRNMGEYLNCVPSQEAGLTGITWAPVVQGIETLFRRLVLILHSLNDPDYLLNIIVAMLKIPSVSKGILDPFSKVMSHCIQHTMLQHKVLNDICCFSMRSFSKVCILHSVLLLEKMMVP